MTDLLSPVIATLSVLAGGVGVAVVNFRSERRKDLALERQQLRQEAAAEAGRRLELTVEHQKWLREHRQKAYLSFLVAVDEAREASRTLILLVKDEQTSPAQLAEAMEVERAAGSALIRSCQPVQIVGPEPVAAVAAELRGHLLHRRNLIAAAGGNRRRTSMAPMSADDAGALTSSVGERTPMIDQARQRFESAARAALADLLPEG